jgi:hypothetical protein
MEDNNQIKMFVLYIIDSLNGQEKLVNRYFVSQEEAQKYCADNDLILSRILTDIEFNSILQHQQSQQLMKQQYRGYQSQQPRQITTVQEEPEEPPQQRTPKPAKPVFPFVQYKPVHPPQIHPNFVITKKRGK